MTDITKLQWSSTYAVAATPSAQRGDKIILPQSALEGLLSASRNRLPQTMPSFSTYHQSVWGDPSSIAPQPELPHPLTFRLVNSGNGKTVYAGVREFSSEESQVVLTPFLLDALGIELDKVGKDTGIPIAVHAEQLSLGKLVRLRPLEAGYIPDDWRPLLEREFRRNFTTLTRDTIVSVQNPKGDEYHFLVDQVATQLHGADDDDDGPQDTRAICIVDTDLEVDIEALNEEQARETVAHLMRERMNDGGEIDIWKPIAGNVEADRYVDFTLPSWNKSSPLVVELFDLEDDAPVDLFVSPRSSRYRALPRDSEHVFGAFGAPVNGKKSITIQPTNVTLEDAESVLVAVYSYKGPPLDSSTTAVTPFSLRISHSLASATTPTTASPNEASNETHAGEEQCNNCKSWVSERSIVLHESFCRRNNTPCPQCKRVFKKGSPEIDAHWHCPHDEASGDSASSRTRHDHVYHTTRTCPCGMSCPSLPALATHRTSNCPEKLILCQFCHLEVAQEGDPSDPTSQAALRGITEHEFAEGGRTAECHLCSRVVRLFDMTTHLKLHEHEKSLRRSPLPCPNVNCGRVINGPLTPPKLPNPSSFHPPPNPPFLCAHCAGPLHATMHDPENKALRRRIERRYLQQLMVGCAKSWCQNEFCRTGRANRGLAETGKGTKDVFPMVKPLMEKLPGEGGPVWFCVDPSSSAQRAMAEALAAEQVWDLSWCIAACEAESCREAQAREWLSNWAPRKGTS